MPWLNILGKLSPSRVLPILREGQCSPVSDYNKTPNMPSDHHDSPPDQFEADEQEERSSIGDSSLLAPPTSLHRPPYTFSSRPTGPHELHSFLDELVTSPDPPIALATVMSLGSAAASSGPMRAVVHTEHSDGVTLPNPHSPSPHPSWLQDGRASPPDVPLPHQSLFYPDGYAPAESLPPQNYIPPARTVPSSSAPFFPPGTHGIPIYMQSQGAATSTPPILGIHSPTTFVPPNSELARPPRFSFAPPGTDVPADPVASTAAASPTKSSPTSPRSWREKAKARLDKSSQQSTPDRSGGRARSHSWSVVPSVFRRRSGRRSGPTPLTPLSADGPPQLSASDWCDLAQWIYRPTDSIWGESFDIALHVELEVSLPPLPAHLSHLPAPSAPLLRPNTLTSALNPFLVHRSAGVPPLSWDLRVAAHAVLFPVSGPGGPAVPMPTSDYAQPATWPPCGALRIGAIGGHAGWRWPVEARNPAGVRCGDVFRALVANLHSYVRQDELADMPPEHITVVAAACTARVATGFPPGSSSSESSAAPDGIRRVDCLMGYTHFHGLEPGPGTGEWTMFVGAP